MAVFSEGEGRILTALTQIATAFPLPPVPQTLAQVPFAL